MPCWHLSILAIAFRESHVYPVLQIKECYAETLSKAYDHCGELYSGLMKCSAANDSHVRKCSILRTKFEACYTEKAMNAKK